jgi:uncharacterized glyoxalase superfamily protein PhnB
MMYSVDRIEVTVTVPSIEETAAWYERVLGWAGNYDAFDDDGHCVFGSVSRGKAAVSGEGGFTGFNLSRASAKDAPVSSRSQLDVSPWVFVDDVDAVYAQVVERGAAPESAPADQPWGGRVFVLRDLNGLRLTFVEMMDIARKD